jgi:hypothetical protein
LRSLGLLSSVKAAVILRVPIRATKAEVRAEQKRAATRAPPLSLVRLALEAQRRTRRGEVAALPAELRAPLLAAQEAAARAALQQAALQQAALQQAALQQAVLQQAVPQQAAPLAKRDPEAPAVRPEPAAARRAVLLRAAAEAASTTMGPVPFPVTSAAIRNRLAGRARARQRLAEEPQRQSW